jgi:hypothetical protein
MRLLTFLLASVMLALAPAAVLAQSIEPGSQPLSLPEARKLLADKNPQVRLRGALELTAQLDETGIGALIDLLADLPADERRQAEQALRRLAGEWSPNPHLPGEDEVSRKLRREVWAGWWRTVNGPALLAAFRERTLSKEETAAAQGRYKLPLSAPGLLAARQPAGASAALLAYLPHSDDRAMKDEIIKALKHLIAASEKQDSAVLQALSDPLPLRRSVAAEVLVGTGGVKHWQAVRPLLKDTDRSVRLRVALALINSHDKEAVPALIGLLAELPRGEVWEAEDLLHRLAGSKAPKVPFGADDAAARKKLANAWHVWWKTHGAEVNLASLEKTISSSGLTLIAEADAKGAGFGGGGPVGAGQNGKVFALDRTGQVRWKIDNLDHPIDVQLLPGGRVLIAEYYGKRVTERDFKGKILWEVNLPNYPANVQRLANGNTFVALYGTPLGKANGQPTLVEVDPTGKTVASFNAPAGAAGGPAGLPGGFAGIIRDMIFAAHKTADGKMVCLMYDQSCVWMDATGKEIKRFAVPLAKGSSPLNTVGNIDVTPKGHVLFAHRDGTVAEYDMDGKVVWQAKVNGTRATRLANGNTLVALLNGGVVELDTAGRTVWQYDLPSGQQATRARR